MNKIYVISVLAIVITVFYPIVYPVFDETFRYEEETVPPLSNELRMIFGFVEYHDPIIIGDVPTFDEQLRVVVKNSQGIVRHIESIH